MSPVVHDGIAKLPTDDQQALVEYVASLMGTNDAGKRGEAAATNALAINAGPDSARFDADARLYGAACASCHYNGAGRINPGRPDLALNSAIHLPSPANLIRVILFGVDAKTGMPGVVMPAFHGALSDEEIARIAAYLRRTRTNLAPWPELEKQVREIREQGPGA